MSDPTEPIRRELLAEINAQPGSREALEAEHGQVWDTDEMCRRLRGYWLHGTSGRRPTRGQDGVKGSLLFQHNPRFYFGFQPH